MGETFIEVVPHPHSLLPRTTIPLSGNRLALHHATPQVDINCHGPDSLRKPWAPFRNRSDFEFAELVVNERLSRGGIQCALRGMHGPWSKDGSNITMNSADDLEKSLAAARKFVLGVRCHHFSVIQYLPRILFHISSLRQGVYLRCTTDKHMILNSIIVTLGSGFAPW